MTSTDQGESLYIDFLALAIQDEVFGKIYQRNGGAVDFKNPQDIQYWPPQTRLALAAQETDRIKATHKKHLETYEYVRWLQMLVDTTSDTYTETYDPMRRIIGIDIGTGASAIYPLLACSQRPTWRFIATELDAISHAHAERNITANTPLASRIRLRRATTDGSLLPNADLTSGIHATFTMCNPPFFASAADMAATNHAKSKPPSAICTGAPIEMVCPGGDLGFARRLLAESVHLRGSVQWYTIMLGKLASAVALVSDVRAAGVSNWAVAALQAGHKTKRWVVGWSFGGLRPRNDVARGQGVARELLPFPTEFVMHGVVAFEGEVRRRVREVLGALNVRWRWDDAAEDRAVSGVCVAKGNVWSRAARRKQAISKDDGKTKAKSGGGAGERIGDDSASSDDTSDDEDAALVVRITLAATEGQVTIRWLRGQDSVLWESFCGMLKREVVKGLGVRETKET